MAVVGAGIRRSGEVIYPEAGKQPAEPVSALWLCP